MSESESSSGKPLPSVTEWERYYDIMRAHDLTELEVKEGDRYVRLSRAAPAVHGVPIQAVAGPFTSGGRVMRPATVDKVSAPPKEDGHAVVSPLGGVFYRSPAPSAPPFVKEGDKVSAGDVLCIVEAMKVMNEIRADRGGLLRKVVAENGKPVSAGQELFLIELH